MRRISVLLLMGAMASGCTPFRADSLSWIDGSSETRYGNSTMAVRWTKRLSELQGAPFVPVENAQVVFDEVRDRVYIGSADGRFYALDSRGRTYFTYDPGAGVEAGVALDRVQGQLFLAAEDGQVHALETNGDVRWTESAGGPVRQTPVIDEEALYLAREDDAVVAMDRDEGEVFWTYRREEPVEFSVSGRAGLVQNENHIITGFADGTVVALDRSDGSLVWERITAVDVEHEEGAARQFFDVDTTPIVHDGVLYVASFNAGLYALDPASGTVLWRDRELTGVTGLAASGDVLILASANEGVRAMHLPRRQLLWALPNEHGAPATPVVSADYVLVAESLGSLRALRLDTGREVSRIDLGTGFSSAPTTYQRYGFAFTNGGRLIAFSM